MLITNYGSVASSSAIKTLAEYSWSDIDRISQSGLASTYFAVGDEKNIVVNGETITMQIYGFNHDTLSSDGTSKAGITFGMKHLMASTRQRNSIGYINAWVGSTMQSWISSTLIGQIPSDLQTALKMVNKYTSAGNKSMSIVTSQEKVFLFSEKECFGTNVFSRNGEGSRYQIFINGASTIKNANNGSGSPAYWWLRSPYATDDYSSCVVYSNGGIGAIDVLNYYSVCFGFCV